jgi:diguanylate cyclase (GGDEF)-like protein
MTLDHEALYRRVMLLEKEVDHLSTLREIGLAISGALELNQALPVIANVVQGALDIRRFTLFELQTDNETFRPIIAKFGDDLISRERLEEESMHRQGTPLGEAIDSRSVVLLSRPPSHEAYVPLIAKEETLGVMVLQDPQDGLPFGDDERVLLQQLGSQISIAISNARLYALAVTGGLTGLFVRRYFDLRMEEELDSARRYDRKFSLLMFDIVHFKKFNDTYGHQTGDMVLQQFANILTMNTRGSDVCCRYGGEEMTVILPETGIEEAALLANKLCAIVRTHTFEGTEEKSLSVTCSIGVAQFSESCASPAEMVKAADEVLYQAKELGRNRVEIAGIDR